MLKKQNKRIQELYGNALDKSVPYTWHNLDHIEVEKIMSVFAGLIVGQMLEITDAHTEVFQTDRDKAVIEHIKKSVKEHFGVEE